MEKNKVGNDFLKSIIEVGQCADEGYFQFAHIVAVLLDKRLHESLNQLINGPIWDGDLISKSNKEELIYLGLALRVCHKGNQGYTGATYFAYTVMKRAKEIKEGKVAA